MGTTDRLSSLRGRQVVFTGRFSTGRQEDLIRRVRSRGGTVSDKQVTSRTSILVVGAPVAHYKFGDHGTKIDDAMALRRRGQPIYFITEGEFQQLASGRGLSDAQSAAALAVLEPEDAGMPFRPSSSRRTTNGTLTIDLDARDRATAAHHRVCRRLAEAVEAAGLQPLSPFTHGWPQYDLAWNRGRKLWVVEVKTVSTKSERQQIRLGLGQVLDYRVSMERLDYRVQPVLAISAPPSDGHWEAVCEAAGVKLCWPDNWKHRLGLR